MTDLCLCVPGQIVKYRNDAFGTYAGSDNSGDTYQFHTSTKYGNLQSHTRFGWISASGVRHPYDVVEILPLETPEEKPPIDLSACVYGQKVRLSNNSIGVYVECHPGERHVIQTQKKRNHWYHRDGRKLDPFADWLGDVVEILPLETPEEKPPIDLSICVPDQKVRFANGKIGKVGGSVTQFGLSKVRTIQANDFGWCWYTLDGKDTDELGPEWQIVEILPLEIPEEEPMTTPQEMDYKTAYLDIAMTLSVAFPECEVATTDMAKLLIHENRTLRMALGLPSYKQVSDAIDDEQME